MLNCNELPVLIVVADFGFVGNQRKWIEILHQIASCSEGNHLAVQVRIKNCDESQYLSLAQQALDALGPNCRTILNGSSRHAQELGYWGAHLPQRNVQTEETSRGNLSFLSAAVHNISELSRAQELPITAAVCSPVFNPSWKASRGIGLESLRSLCNASSVPVFALGGITPANSSSCLAAGAHGIATLSGVMGAADAASAIELFLNSVSRR